MMLIIIIIFKLWRKRRRRTYPTLSIPHFIIITLLILLILLITLLLLLPFPGGCGGAQACGLSSRQPRYRHDATCNIHTYNTQHTLQPRPFLQSPACFLGHIEVHSKKYLAVNPLAATLQQVDSNLSILLPTCCRLLPTG